MFKMLARWHKSGRNQHHWCAEHDITLSKFKYWFRKWKLFKESESSPGFLEINGYEPTPVLAEKLSVHFPNGVRLEFDIGVDYQVLMLLIKQF